MSKYTTEVRFICEEASGLRESVGLSRVDEIIETACPIVFDFDFPIFDEDYRLTLEKKILRHYYTKEICEETVGLWKLRLEDRLNLIMPYYNKLYNSELLEINPLYNVNITRDHAGTFTGNTQGTESGTNSKTGTKSEATESETSGTKVNQKSETTNMQSSQTVETDGTETDTFSGTNQGSKNGSGNYTDWDLYSDTPQGGVVGINNADIQSPTSVANMAYLTNARRKSGNYSDTESNSGSNNSTDTKATDMTTESTGTSSGSLTGSDNETTTGTGEINVTGNYSESGTNSGNMSRTINNTDGYLEHVYGYQGTKSIASLLQEWRSTFLNIDAMIIEELSDLFFGLWA